MTTHENGDQTVNETCMLYVNGYRCGCNRTQPSHAAAHRITSSGRYAYADPAAHPYEAADPRKPWDGCRSCGYLQRSHPEAAR